MCQRLAIAVATSASCVFQLLCLSAAVSFSGNVFQLQCLSAAVSFSCSVSQLQCLSAVMSFSRNLIEHAKVATARSTAWLLP